LSEFQGRHPTLQEVASIPPRQWLKVPGVGQTLLTELETVVGVHQDWMKTSTSASPTDAEMVDQLERLQRDLERLRRELRTLIDNIRRKQSNSDSSDDH
jgi:hypothetical protein